jgi:hypothetical protein
MGLEWQQCYVEALLETDVVNLVARVTIAEGVILSRVRELCLGSGDEEEWQAIEDAISGLSVLRREILKSPIEKRATLASVTCANSPSTSLKSISPSLRKSHPIWMTQQS